MTSLTINGDQASLRTDGLNTVADFVELIKSSIDPDHMITSILIDGKELSDDDWRASPGQFATSIFEIETDTTENFVVSRLIQAPDIVQACYLDFREARKLFQQGDSADGNKVLVRAVQTFQAFFDWYGSLMELLTTEEREVFSINDVVEEISTVCKQICQQQLYQSWWAIGESLQNQLEPKLDELETICRGFRKQLAA